MGKRSLVVFLDTVVLERIKLVLDLEQFGVYAKRVVHFYSGLPIHAEWFATMALAPGTGGKHGS